MISALLTKQQIANQFLHSSLKQVDRLVADGSLHKVKLGKRKAGAIRDNRPVRFRLSEVLGLVGMTETEYSSIDPLMTNREVSPSKQETIFSKSENSAVLQGGE